MNAIKWIANEAKKLRRAHPNKHKKYTGYVKDAGAKYRATFHKATLKKKKSKSPGRKTKTKTTVMRKRKSSPRKRVSVKKSRPRSSRRRGSIGSIASTRQKLKDQLKEQLAWGLLGISQTKGKMKKRKLAKKLVPVRAQLRILSK